MVQIHYGRFVVVSIHLLEVLDYPATVGQIKVLKVGDTVDFWKVLEMVPESKLLLLSEMKAPGQALLEFRIEKHG